MIKSNLYDKPRVIISTDFPPMDCNPGGSEYGIPEKKSDLDDIQSMVRFLCYSNEFKVEGLIASSSTFANIADKKGLQDIINIYAEVYNNLCLHDPYYPSPKHLYSITKQGFSGAWGAKVENIIGEGMDTEASEHIISVIDDPNPNPVWICFWGGPRELGQALWKVQNTRSASELSKFVSKIRVYFVGLQDGSGQWMLDTFSELKTVTLHPYHCMANRSVFDGKWLREHIINQHGALGAVYPPANWIVGNEGVYEGDTPSFLYLISGINGLGDLDMPWLGGWGGCFHSSEHTHWEGSDEALDSIVFWEKTRNWDFAARMDWCIKSYKEANHNPVAILNGDSSKKILFQTAAPGEKVFLSAEGSFDPDGDNLSYHWFQYMIDKNAPQVEIIEPGNCNTSFEVPQEPCEIHIILEVTDDGSPSLTSYRRFVVTINKE